MFGNPLASGLYPRGTLCAGIGLIIIAAYYMRALKYLRGRPDSSLVPDTLVSPGSQTWPKLRYLQRGILASVFFFMLSGAADSANDWLDGLVRCLIGLVAAVGVGIFGVGFICLANLWKELVLQLRKAKIRSLLLSIPLAAIWIALGLGVFFLAGMFLDKFSNSWISLTRPLIWGLIALMFYTLWKGRSHGALMARVILMVSFSTIIVAAAAFGYWWMISETAPLLVIFLSAIGFLDVIFYSRWVRLLALKDNLE